MNNRLLIWALLVFGGAGTALAGNSIAAAGRVEPVGEERIVIAEASGRLKRVLVNEGDLVRRGQLLAEIENDEQLAVVAQATASVNLYRAAYDILRNGARREELAAAQASEREAEASWQRKRQEALRREKLFEQKQISAEQLDDAHAAEKMVFEALARNKAQRELLENGARAEERRKAEAALQIAQADLSRAQAALEKTRIRSPIDGTVLKRELREGEMVTSLNPLPLVRIGDLRSLVVRAEIDELDITRIKNGLAASISSDAFPGQNFSGKVIHVSQRMGNRQIRSDNPADKEDVRVLETLIALEGSAALPVGLRVDVKISLP